MTNKNAKTETEHKKDELNAVLQAGEEVYVNLCKKFPGIQDRINPEATVLAEFMKFLEDIGVVTELQLIQFQIDHGLRVIENLKNVDREVSARQRQAALNPMGAKKSGLIIPGRG